MRHEVRKGVLLLVKVGGKWEIGWCAPGGIVAGLGSERACDEMWGGRDGGSAGAEPGSSCLSLSILR